MGTKTHTISSRANETLDDTRFEKFFELTKSLYLQIPLVDAIKIPPYSKYMKEIGRAHV